MKVVISIPFTANGHPGLAEFSICEDEKDISEVDHLHYKFEFRVGEFYTDLKTGEIEFTPGVDLVTDLVERMNQDMLAIDYNEYRRGRIGHEFYIQ